MSSKTKLIPFGNKDKTESHTTVNNTTINIYITIKNKKKKKGFLTKLFEKIFGE
jgi:hypothetical protein